MGAQKLLFLKTHFDMLGRGFFVHLLYEDMLPMLCSFWVLLCNFFFFVLGSISRYLSRVAVDEGSRVNKYSSHLHGSEQEKELNSDNIEESRINGERSVLVEAASSKYQFSSGIGITGFVEEPKAMMMSFVVEEMFLDSSDSTITSERSIDAVASEEAEIEERENVAENTEYVPTPGDGATSEEEDQDKLLSGKFFSFNKLVLSGAVADDRKGSLVDAAIYEETVEEKTENSVEKSIGDQNVSCQNQEQNELLLCEEENLLGEDQFFLEDSFSRIDSKMEVIDHNCKVYCSSYKGIEPEDFSSSDDGEAVERIPEENFVILVGDGQIIEGTEEISIPEENLFKLVGDGENLERAEEISAGVADQAEQSDDEFIKMKLEGTPSISNKGTSDYLAEDLDCGDRGPSDVSYSESMEFKPQEHSSFHDQDDSDSMWEHDDIIEQLKLELKHAKTGGLPTILEETETETESEFESKSPTVMVNDLKPMKTIIDQKVEHKDRIIEIQKVYRSYAEKMRKLDVLNYQTMHAIGLLQLKDPVNSSTMQKPPGPAMKSFLSPNLLPLKLRKNKIGPFIRSMESFSADLEMVYVGQLCLSWEILQWQYGKTRELLESDPSNYRQYNQVANEFQLFQVLLQRFIENESFQGPRIENYVKNRCVVRSLLQVPAVRDDGSIDKKRKVGTENAVSNTELIDIVEESIRVMWDFIRSDKCEADTIQKGSRKSQFDLLDSADLTLQMAVRNNLQKKERRLKDIIRSRNCIVKRFQKHQDRVGHTLLFAQIELKLISRVLSMRKLTKDQLLWCGDKLDRTSIVSRKIYVEPSFLLFPC